MSTIEYRIIANCCTPTKTHSTDWYSTMSIQGAAKDCIANDDMTGLSEAIQSSEVPTKEQWATMLSTCSQRSNDSAKCLLFLIEYGISHIKDVSESETLVNGDHNILIYASSQDASKCIKQLLEYIDSDKFKLDLQYNTEDKWTALHYCAYNGNEESCQWLIEKGANANAMDCMGYTPLMRAAEAQAPRVLGALLATNPDVNFQNEKKWSAIHFAGKFMILFLFIISYSLNHASIPSFSPP